MCIRLSQFKVRAMPCCARAGECGVGLMRDVGLVCKLNLNRGAWLEDDEMR